MIPQQPQQARPGQAQTMDPAVTEAHKTFDSFITQLDTLRERRSTFAEQVGNLELRASQLGAPQQGGGVYPR